MEREAVHEFIRVSEAARRLGVRAETVRVWFDQGKICGIRLPGNGERRISREDVNRILAADRGARG